MGSPWLHYKQVSMWGRYFFGFAFYLVGYVLTNINLSICFCFFVMFDLDSYHRFGVFGCSLIHSKF